MTIFFVKKVCQWASAHVGHMRGRARGAAPYVATLGARSGHKWPHKESNRARHEGGIAT